MELLTLLPLAEKIIDKFVKNEKKKEFTKDRLNESSTYTGAALLTGCLSAALAGQFAPKEIQIIVNGILGVYAIYKMVTKDKK